jgi:hypothetical protein
MFYLIKTVSHIQTAATVLLTTTFAFRFTRSLPPTSPSHTGLIDWVFPRWGGGMGSARNRHRYRLVHLVRLQMDNFFCFFVDKWTNENFWLHNTEIVNGWRKIAWATILRFLFETVACTYIYSSVCIYIFVNGIIHILYIEIWTSGKWQLLFVCCKR